MAEAGTPNELVGLVVSDKVVDADDPLPVAVVGGAGGAATTPIVVGGTLAVASVEKARLADATPYTAKDVIDNITGDLWVFSNMARVVGGSGYITRGRAFTDQKTCIARLRLHLYNAAPTAILDNQPYLLLYADRAKRVGWLDFPALATEDASGSTAAAAQNITDRLPFVCGANDRNLYGILETLDAFTPASGQNFSIELLADQN